MFRNLSLPLVMLSLGMLLAWDYAQPRPVQAGCFICDDYYDEDLRSWYHNDYPLFYNDLHGTNHGSGAMYSCGGHLGYEGTGGGGGGGGDDECPPGEICLPS
jgi:hypothetical protein